MMDAQLPNFEGFTAQFVGEPGVRDAIKFTRDSDKREVAMIVEIPREELIEDPIDVRRYSVWQVWACMPYGSWSIADCRPRFETKAQAVEFTSLMLKAKVFDWVSVLDCLDLQERCNCVFYAPKGRTHYAILLGVIQEPRSGAGPTKPSRLEYGSKIEKHSWCHEAFESLVKHYALPENQLP